VGVSSARISETYSHAWALTHGLGGFEVWRLADPWGTNSWRRSLRSGHLKKVGLLVDILCTIYYSAHVLDLRSVCRCEPPDLSEQQFGLKTC